MVGDRKKRSPRIGNWRINVLKGFFVLLTGVIVLRLFSLQVIQADFYQAISSGQHEFYQELVAERGTIYVSDWKDGSEYAAGTNEAKAFIYAEPRKIEDPTSAADAIARILGYEKIDVANIEDIELAEDEGDQNEDVSSNDYETLLSRLSKSDDPYEPIVHDIDENILDKILALEIEGIHYVLEEARAYPEANLGGQIFGFVSESAEDGQIGQYGVEGYYDDFLSGDNGFLDAVTDSTGSCIWVVKRDFEAARDG